MKAVQLPAVNSPLRNVNVELPKLQGDDVLVRVAAAGICHSDVHYQDGTSTAGPFPLTPGHEVAGFVDAFGPAVDSEVLSQGSRVAVHYLITCGACRQCLAGGEQFCPHGRMIGKHRDGGYAEYLVVPARNILPVPESVELRHAAVAMCSSATSFHAIRRAALKPGESVAVIGAGGLGLSAVQLAFACGAGLVYAVDLDEDRLKRAAAFGAIPVLAGRNDPVQEVLGRRPMGIDVVVDLVGTPKTVRQGVAIAGIGGRLAVAGISDQPALIDTYAHLIAREVSVLGVSDHTKPELEILLGWLADGRLDLSSIVTETVPLDADQIQAVLDRRRSSGSGVRTVILP